MTSPVTDFADKVVVITGGANGIGRALAHAFASERAHLVIADVEKPLLDLTVEGLRSSSAASVMGVITDVSDPDSVEALAEEVFSHHGACHVLVNNAGVGAPAADVWDTTPNDWRWVHSVNVFGVAFGIQSFVPRMIASGEPGYVVNTSSGDGAISPLPTASVYAASKAAVSITTECLAAQFIQQGLPLAASLFLPGGAGLLDTGLWTADRNRPPELARERPRSTPPTTVASLREKMASVGQELPIQPLDELALTVLDGIRAGTYCIAIGLSDAAETLHRRADRFAAGRVPVDLEPSMFERTS
jgi:NAD(P)-dependent dehydrogenase (short-subunit alcohol dehydrogenase family)